MPNQNYIAWYASGGSGGQNVAIRGNGDKLELSSGGGLTMTMDANQRVGIGTSTPSEKLDLQGTMNMNAPSGTYLQIQYNGANRGYLGTANAIIGGGSTGDLGLAATSNLVFGSGGSLTERMRITSGGNVGIGNAGNAGYKLFVSGNTYIVGATSTGADISLLVQNSSSTTLFYTRNDGLVSTGLAASSPYNNTSATLANAIFASDGTLQRSTVSSIRYKENIKDWNGNGLDTILALKPKTFKYKKEHFDKGDIDFLGLIAEEVAEVSPYLADYENEDRTGQVENVRYANIVVPLIKAVQELKIEKDAEIAELRAQIEELKAMIAAK
jgi:hypothetical protein